MQSSMSTVKDIVNKLAKQAGYRVEERGEKVVITHPNAPIFIEVFESSRGIMVKIGHENLKDYVREIIDTEENPRDYIEDVLDDVSSLALRIVEALRQRGLSVVSDTRTGVMDVLEELEEAEEE
ncbi:hypothetical protein PYJP_16090 [Pyrofollis japonicus]|uniref:hypothetical protein n=1 Tax=Pyrofollis japonicus TaxID=3060460 RepID=UPI00295A7484|nr:hypothetical protein [Pyrofollis japonicus]BEP18257.1 hypothetical protein PYJP_16090 [Pyrofollis japonicus]